MDTWQPCGPVYGDQAGLSGRLYRQDTPDGETLYKGVLLQAGIEFDCWHFRGGAELLEAMRRFEALPGPRQGRAPDHGAGDMPILHLDLDLEDELDRTPDLWKHEEIRAAYARKKRMAREDLMDET